MVTLMQIERGICDRLQRGLGIAVSGVVSWDVMTNDIGVILKRLPGAFVTFTGITGSHPHDTRRTRYKVSGNFAVYVADYSLRGNQAIRQGAARVDEPGCYRLVRAVRHLLMGQDLGLEIGRLAPTTVKMITGQVFSQKAIGMYECQFSTFWYEDAMENGSWPVAPEYDTHPDHDFVLWKGQLDDAPREHRATHAAWQLQGQPVADDTVLVPAKSKPESDAGEDGPLL
ncbi:phage protein Gp37 [Cedecea sp. NFIX57]|uniref:phage protein Gp37 n=1 Tax=Cedecea sp. NFIX57 TaxID=1566286 RepID=UPI000A0B05BA|nr:phage protein Gp37 [Cedecea sp. NFIX57]SMG61809.1 Mu-like prophage protein gp37 [Cedecea sp. NFIX57]